MSNLSNAHPALNEEFEFEFSEDEMRVQPIINNELTKTRIRVVKQIMSCKSLNEMTAVLLTEYENIHVYLHNQKVSNGAAMEDIIG